ncbi:hypothetical protein DSM25559_4497 [Agrobacterium rosae]|uniref:Uncharacterized protein n=1 Tax=Agrobacterium rosae TaxID=1972867 RepID=A0A1R3U0Q5_9HYPH|nr:hypothetical protein DSM25559_4497 [Agrobacterium rosae]
MVVRQEVPHRLRRCGKLRFFRAIKSAELFNHVVSIRGISDPCANKRGIGRKSKTLRKAAMDNAVDVFVDMIIYMYDTDFPR